MLLAPLRRHRRHEKSWRPDDASRWGLRPPRRRSRSKLSTSTGRVLGDVSVPCLCFARQTACPKSRGRAIFGAVAEDIAGGCSEHHLSARHISASIGRLQMMACTRFASFTSKPTSPEQRGRCLPCRRGENARQVGAASPFATAKRLPTVSVQSRCAVVESHLIRRMRLRVLRGVPTPFPSPIARRIKNAPWLSTPRPF
jgi:hypothetical protein